MPGISDNIVTNPSPLPVAEALHAHYNGGLDMLEPGYKTLLHIKYAMLAMVILAIAIGVSLALQEGVGLMPAYILVPVLFLVLPMVIVLPARIWRRWGYDMGDNRLQVVRGYMFHTDTIVPFARVQHIDVAHGPLENLLGLARLIVHTAGTHNNTVTLPGLSPEKAAQMRAIIREHIREDIP